MQIRVVNQVSTSPLHWHSALTRHLLISCRMPGCPNPPPAALGRIRLRERFWTPKCLVGNEKQYFCGVKASLRNVVVCKAIPAPLPGREGIDVHIDRSVKKFRLHVIHWGLYQ